MKSNRAKILVISLAISAFAMMALVPAPSRADAASDGAKAGAAAGKKAAIDDQPPDEKASSSKGGCCG